MSPQEMVSAMATKGYTDEQIAVLLGNKLGVTNPSSQAVRRWRIGRGNPSRTMREALVKVYEDSIASGA